MRPGPNSLLFVDESSPLRLLDNMIGFAMNSSRTFSLGTICSIPSSRNAFFFTVPFACLKDTYTQDTRYALSKLLHSSSGFLRNASPIHSLRNGSWVKLICGASFEDVVDVRNLSLVYTLAGVDCIDCAAESSVVSAVREGINSAIHLAGMLHLDAKLRTPWIMVSVNDDEDLHFRKAEFDPNKCPSDCSRPCEQICPASAIQFNTISFGNIQQGAQKQKEGVISERCYGCGRCIPVCLFRLIDARSYVSSPQAVSELLNARHIDAIEIHTNGRNLEAFKKLWECLHSSLHVKLIAISLPDFGDAMISKMWELYDMMKPSLRCPNLWQLDGRPMSGDIGAGATIAAVTLAIKVAKQDCRPPGFLQLAGGTNAYTVEALKKSSLYERSFYRKVDSKSEPFSEGMRDFTVHEKRAPIAGIAYGGYARKIVSQLFRRDDFRKNPSLEQHPELLIEAVEKASTLVALSKKLFY